MTWGFAGDDGGFVTIGDLVDRLAGQLVISFTSTRYQVGARPVIRCAHVDRRARAQLRRALAADDRRLSDNGQVSAEKSIRSSPDNVGANRLDGAAIRTRDVCGGSRHDADQRAGGRK